MLSKKRSIWLPSVSSEASSQCPTDDFWDVPKIDLKFPMNSSSIFLPSLERPSVVDLAFIHLVDCHEKYFF